MFTKKTALSFVAIALVLVVIGINLFQKNEELASIDPSQTRVGAIIPLTGEVATYGDSLKKGYDLAASEFDGKIAVVYEDSKANPTEGVTAMQKLLSQGVRHFLGDATSGVSLALAPLADQNKALLMISIATSDKLTGAGPYVFRNCPPNSRQATAAAEFVEKQLKASRVAVLAKANPYAANLAAEFKKEAAKRGMTVVLDEQYELSARDFSVLVEKLRRAQVDAAFIPGNYEDTARLLRKVLRLPLLAGLFHLLSLAKIGAGEQQSPAHSDTNRSV
uniref:Substrate-binding protein n=1 Tax=Candidatus Kentrum sp. DK TaxID=2126562 RepID=A0A450SVC0_9GAMM|nr:MAG: substrate-binding protein [Candidatus Kentron sp. DK]